MALAKHYQRKPAPKERDFPRLDADGLEVLDSHSLVAEMMFRPPTLQEQISRLNEAGKIHRFLPDDDYADDDYGDDYDDIPDEGLTTYELDAIGIGLPKPSKSGKPKKATTPPGPDEPAPGGPKEPDGDGSDEEA